MASEDLTGEDKLLGTAEQNSREEPASSALLRLTTPPLTWRHPGVLNLHRKLEFYDSGLS